MLTILLLEDDAKLAAEIKLFLSTQGYNCKTANDGASFYEQSLLKKYALYILDINVPVLNGIEVCKKIRATDDKTPILMLTAYDSIQKKVEALDYGADDYLVKPFHLDELLARVKALLRRSGNISGTGEAIYTIADLTIDTLQMKVTRSDKEISLTPKEYKLLELLARSKGKIVSKQTIAKQVWEIHFETGTNTIEVYIRFLRNKIDKGFSKPLIHTKPGYGYYLKEKSE